MSIIELVAGDFDRRRHPDLSTNRGSPTSGHAFL